MGNTTKPEAAPPTPARLDISQFPKEPWAKTLVSVLNQFFAETVTALGRLEPTYKELTFRTGASLSGAFPIDITLPFAPLDVHVAQVLSGTVAGALSVRWQPLVSGRKQSQAGNYSIRVSYIDGLAVGQLYTLRLAVR